MSVDKLKRAQKNKNDEFYTRYEDVANEMQHYAQYFVDKTIYCPCDNINSAFTRYFIDNFSKFALKKLICTSLNGQLITYDGETIKQTQLNGDGDIFSNECEQYFKECDIIITNPPFSLFKDFINYINQFNKQFILITTLLNLGWRDIFPHIQSKEWKLGINGRTMYFNIPDDMDIINPKILKYDENGNKQLPLPNVVWLQNIADIRHNPPLKLTQKYSPDKYPKFDNYNAINVDKVKDIPSDYYGLMGVPISYLYKHNDEQFEIVWIAQGWINKWCNENHEMKETIGYDHSKTLYSGGQAFLNQKAKFSRVLIQQRIGYNHIKEDKGGAPLVNKKAKFYKLLIQRK